MAPSLPEEGSHFLAPSLTDDGCFVRANAPSYLRWFAGAELRAAYRRHRKLVKLVGSTDPTRRWLLEYSVHVQVDAALEACAFAIERLASAPGG
jgi:hypothetical protein